MYIKLARLVKSVLFVHSQSLIILQNFYCPSAHVFYISNIGKKTSFTFNIYFRQSTCICTNDGHTCSHRLKSSKTKTFIFRRKYKQITDNQNFFHLFLLAQKAHVVR